MVEGLERFLTAQARNYDEAIAELRDGLKQSHWMWYVFPQLAALGRSGTAKFYGIADLAEARAYAAHPVLGPRLRAAAEAVLSHPEDPAARMLGEVDALKLWSSATLFAEAGAPALAAAMERVLATFYQGRRCPLTEAALHEGEPPAPLH